jgi:(2Fe-2S) ferredoxin
LPKPEKHVLVCTNARPPENPRGSCGAKGAEDVFNRLKALVAERGLAGRVMVTRTGCLKHCSRGVAVAVHPENVWYTGVTVADLEEIVTSHLTAGHPVERLLMPDIPWE